MTLILRSGAKRSVTKDGNPKDENCFDHEVHQHRVLLPNQKRGLPLIETLRFAPFLRVRLV